MTFLSLEKTPLRTFTLIVFDEYNKQAIQYLSYREAMWLNPRANHVVGSPRSDAGSIPTCGSALHVIPFPSYHHYHNVGWREFNTSTVALKVSSYKRNIFHVNNQRGPWPWLARPHTHTPLTHEVRRQAKTHTGTVLGSL